MNATPHKAHQGALAAGWIPLLLVIALNGYFSERNVSSRAWRAVANRVQLLDENIFKPNRNENFTGLLIIADSQRDADFLVYLIDPLRLIKNRLAMLDALLSQSIQTFRAVDVNSFSENDHQRPSPTKCNNDWCCAAVRDGAVTRRHRLHPLALAGQHQSHAVIVQRTGSVLVPNHAHKSLDISRKPRFTVRLPFGNPYQPSSADSQSLRLPESHRASPATF